MHLLLLAVVMLAAAEAIPAQAARGYSLSEPLLQLASTPEAQIDLGRAALVLAKDIYPDISIDAYSRQIDELAAKAKGLARGSTDPEQRIRALNTVLFRDSGFHYDRDPFSRSREDYYFLNRVLDTRRGLCYSLPLLYLAVAQRLGYPMHAVIVPDHVFVRYSAPDFAEANIETTSGGRFIADDAYARDFAVSETGRTRGSYLASKTNREFLGQMFAASAFVWSRHGQGWRAIALLERARELDPRSAEIREALGELYEAAGRTRLAKERGAWHAKAEKCFAQARELGFVDVSVIAVGTRTRGR